MSHSTYEPSPDEDAHRKWKQAAAPMYDWMTNHHLVWPALACRFGKARPVEGDGGKYTQTIYYSEQVSPSEKTSSNKLVMQSVMVPHEMHTPMDHINTWKENQKSPYFSKSNRKAINHPGECNKIRTFEQHDGLVVTHSDVAEVFVWDFDRQEEPQAVRRGHKPQDRAPDLILAGHTKPAPFALATSSTSACVASGGEDYNVLVWGLEDHGQGGNGILDRGRVWAGPESLRPRVVLTGHNQTVTDVCFKPGTDNELISVADDQVVKLWDVRSKQCSHTVKQSKDDGLMALDWSADGGHIAAGDEAGTLFIYDVRMLAARSAANPAGDVAVAEALLTFPLNMPGTRSILTVSWNPNLPSWVCSGGDDGRVTVYDIARTEAEVPEGDDSANDGLPPQLVLQHIGHLGNIMDCQWSPTDPYTVMSVSNDGDTYKEGGAIQLWRLSWLLYAPIDKVEEQLQEYRAWLEKGRLADMPNKFLQKQRPESNADGAHGTVR